VTTRDGREYRAGAAVLAAPLNAWNDIEIAPGLSPGKREAAAGGHAGRMQKLWVRVEGAPDDVIGFGLDAKLLWLSSEYALDDGSQLMVAFSAPQNGFAPDGPADVEAAVREYAPDARVVEQDGHDWAADPFAKGTWMVNQPGMLSAHATELQRPEGRLHFAGADIATRWIGWMDGALETGARAALAIVSQQDRAPAPSARA
jgi:monoamine oxidase